MARVFGADGVLDATAIELRVRKAQEERHAAHEDRNAARKLTTSERKAKQLRKMFDENACDVQVQVRYFAIVFVHATARLLYLGASVLLQTRYTET